MASIWTGLTRSVGCIPMCEIAGDEHEAIERKTAYAARNQEMLADWEAFPFKLEVQPPPNKCGYMDHREGCDCNTTRIVRALSEQSLLGLRTLRFNGDPNEQSSSR